MGNYTPGEHLEMFGGLPDRDDPSVARDHRAEADDARKRDREEGIMPAIDSLLAPTPEQKALQALREQFGGAL